MNDLVDCFVCNVDAELDAIGLRCPLPLLKAKLKLRDLADGQVLRVIATDLGSVRDFKSYTRLSGHELLSFSEQGGKYCYLIKK